VARDAAASSAVSRRARRRAAVAACRQRLLGADRHAHGDLLGACLRPQSGGRLCRAPCDRLCRAADSRRLHHERARCRQCDAAVAGVRCVAGRGCRRCCLRRHRRPAGAAPAHLLLRDVDARLRDHRDANRTRLAERDRRRHRHRGTGVSRALQHGLGLLFPLYRDRRIHDLDQRQCRAQPIWPRADRPARRRGRG